MLDTAHAPDLTLSDARIVTPLGVVEGALKIEGGMIAGMGRARDGLSLGGAFLIPGIVDLHTDHV